jgi:hypothetical protein
MLTRVFPPSGTVSVRYRRKEGGESRRTCKVTPKHHREKYLENLVEVIDELEENIKVFKLQMVDREAKDSEVVTGTSILTHPCVRLSPFNLSFLWISCISCITP